MAALVMGSFGEILTTKMGKTLYTLSSPADAGRTPRPARLGPRVPHSGVSENGVFEGEDSLTKPRPR
ncbi:MAG: hypothetical protein ACRDY1_11710 [Acidimicrobiales bacterium]